MLYTLLVVLTFWMTSAQALVLEELIASNMLQTAMQNKHVGYFVGSFDPLHKAHEAIVDSTLNLNLVDCIILHPVWGGDIYKVRSSVDVRLDMLFAVYKNHPKVLVSRLTPKQLQDALSTTFDKTTFVGILGSDTALYLAPNPETSLVYMTGKTIPEEHYEHTWGSCMAIPVSSFIVALRDNDNIDCLNGMLRERPIVATFRIDAPKELSSTALKKALNNNECIDHVVSSNIRTIIDQHKLYR